MAALAVCPRQDIVRSVCRADLLMELAAAQIMGWALEDGFGLRVASGGVLTQDLEQPVGPSLPPASPSSEAMRYQASALPGSGLTPRTPLRSRKIGSYEDPMAIAPAALPEAASL